MKHAKNVSPAVAMLLLLAMASCDGRTTVGELGGESGRLTLQRASLGRLVDVYAYQRIDQGDPDRRNRFNRRYVLVARDVVVNPDLESQSLFDASGAEQPAADYEFLPFDREVGHEELVILWDNQAPSETGNFQRAFQAAQLGLIELAAAFRGQNTQTRPIPIVPRNAAIRLQFDGKVPVEAAFFQANPSAIQLLEFKGDPRFVEPADAFRVLPCRVIPSENAIVLDTTILGGEAQGGVRTPGLPPSADNVTANIRIAIPSRGSLVSTFYVREDQVKDLNDVDSAGRGAVIRDFRSGNLADGPSGRLREPEAPMILGSLGMGITAVDASTNTITLNKRGRLVPVRGRYPFVEGPLSQTGVPLGPLEVPTVQPLVCGDTLTQDIVVEMPDGSFETVRLRAEILQNLEVGTVVGDPLLPFLGLAPVLGSSPTQYDQGQSLPVVRVRVASVVAGTDSLGREWSFRANPFPTGEDCTLRARYYERVRFGSGGQSVSDADWRNLFVRIDPAPTSVGAGVINGVLPNASLAVEFSKPMDLDQVDNSSNLLVTCKPGNPNESFAEQILDPKRATARLVPTRLSDLSGDGTVLRLQPPMGFFHSAGATERYAFHVRLGSAGVTDLGGAPLQTFDVPESTAISWSVDFTLATAAAENRVAWRSYRFEAADEDGTLPGSPDLFGQFQLQNGRLSGAATVRFSRNADNQNLGTISRILRGECWDAANDAQLFPLLPVDLTGAPHPGILYWVPLMSDQIVPPFVPQVYDYWQQVPQPVGRVIEPHKPQGTRMQMRYLEDDFSLDYRAPSDFAIDVEQLYWSPFADETVLYDVFDRYTMALGHSARRPDEQWLILNGNCTLNCASMNSSLSTTFAENVLPGSSQVPVFQDKVYRINPNEAFRTGANVKYVPYPRFDRSYTWRDSRLVTVDADGNVLGLGGAQQPSAQPPNDDVTANIDSPWVASNPDPEFVLAGLSTWVMDDGDFRGSSRLDHDPIALPLLVDFKVYSDGAANGLASGANGFQVALLGPPTGFANPNGPIPGGYYDRQGAGCGGRPAWPRVRVQTTGGEDLVSGQPVLVDVANVLTATGGPVKDAGLGNAARALFVAPPGDGMLHWARADFVRKVSTMTFGFFDTLQPQRAEFVVGDAVQPEPGFPNLQGIAGVGPDLRIRDIVVQIDPPQARQPAGTSVVLEMRGAESFGNDGVLYNPSYDLGGQVPNDGFATRGNLLNANYACEAYRYSTANFNGAPRVTANGLTRYVTEDQVGLIRSPATGLLPRFMNLRLVMTNNVDVTPGLSPSLRSMNIVYRVQAP
ncbi:MAG: hypothetical protein KF830_01915 [Planctomycetes bacterium]|nr:hypothetical protein [Planctomycetota bacterium]